MQSPFTAKQIELLRLMAAHCGENWQLHTSKTGLAKRLKPVEFCQLARRQFSTAPNTPAIEYPAGKIDVAETEDDLADLVHSGDPAQAIDQELAGLDEQEEQLAQQLADRLDPSQRKARVISKALAKLSRKALPVVLLAMGLASCGDPVVSYLNQVATSTTPTCTLLTPAEFRNYTHTFAPAALGSGRAYRVQDAPTPCTKLAPLQKDGRVIERWLYHVDTGLTFALFVENDAVIGYELSPR